MSEFTDEEVRNAVAFVPVTSIGMRFSDAEAEKFDRWLAARAAGPAKVIVRDESVHEISLVPLMVAPGPETCDVYWGSHGCELPPGHDGPCICSDCHDGMVGTDEHDFCAGCPPYYGPGTHFYGDTPVPPQTLAATQQERTDQ